MYVGPATGHASMTVDATVDALPDALLAQKPSSVTLTVRDEDVCARWDPDSDDLTNTTGHLLVAGGTYQVEGAANVRALRLVVASGAAGNATVSITAEGGA